MSAQPRTTPPAVLRYQVAHALHCADETHYHEPWEAVASIYLQMADAALAVLAPGFTQSGVNQ